MERTDRSFRHFVFSLVSSLIWCRITMNTLVCVILIHQGRRPVETIARDKSSHFVEEAELLGGKNLIT
jgi:hypothetical protein